MGTHPASVFLREACDFDLFYNRDAHHRLFWCFQPCWACKLDASSGPETTRKIDGSPGGGRRGSCGGDSGSVQAFMRRRRLWPPLPPPHLLHLQGHPLSCGRSARQGLSAQATAGSGRRWLQPERHSAGPPAQWRRAYFRQLRGRRGSRPGAGPGSAVAA